MSRSESCPHSHPAVNDVRSVEEAVGARPTDDLLSLVQRCSLRAWNTEHLQSPHDVWIFQEWRAFTSMPISEIPTAVSDCLLFVFEAIRAHARQRVPTLHAARELRSDRVVVDVTLVPRGDEDPALEVEASRPFSVEVHCGETCQVVPVSSGPFPLPGFPRRADDPLGASRRPHGGCRGVLTLGTVAPWYRMRRAVGRRASTSMARSVGPCARVGLRRGWDGHRQDTACDACRATALVGGPCALKFCGADDWQHHVAKTRPISRLGPIIFREIAAFAHRVRLLPTVFGCCPPCSMTFRCAAI